MKWNSNHCYFPGALNYAVLTQTLELCRCVHILAAALKAKIYLLTSLCGFGQVASLCCVSVSSFVKCKWYQPTRQLFMKLK